MHEDDFYAGIERRETFTERYLGLSWGKFFLALAGVTGLGVFIGTLLFGENSLEVLLELQEYELYLREEVESLKTQNARLQKEYFELKELERDTRDD